MRTALGAGPETSMESANRRNGNCRRKEMTVKDGIFVADLVVDRLHFCCAASVAWNVRKQARCVEYRVHGAGELCIHLVG